MNIINITQVHQIARKDWTCEVEKLHEQLAKHEAISEKIRNENNKTKGDLVEKRIFNLED